ncbi:DEAD/DEAH box helicase [Bacillus pinisoli]|uniref:DEAD/DEAH box helicase n=1 Tax=Bacillus pinisoli TaxID=2901866 RepID=UPI001FF2B9D4|nr:DEAD/DEAH box helicase [Bacillus pinisoli]
MELSINQFQSYLVNAWGKAGFSSFTDVQARAIPTMLQRKDMMVESPPGTGKTLAYLLPIFEGLKEEVKSPQGVIVAPTRELVMQIHEEAQKFLKDSPFSSASFIGGADLKRQLEKLKKHPQIIIGTPHRLVELIEMRKLKMHEVKTIVLDEADQLLSSGATKEIDRVIQSTLKDRQLVAFSATLPQLTMEQLGKRMNNPEKITINASLDRKEKIQYRYIVSERRDKLDNLRKLLHTEPDMKAIAFINDSFHLEALAEKMKYKKIQAGVLYSQSTQAEREATIKKFRLGKYQLLLATDVAARGLDIEAITHVVHLDLPQEVEQFVHRSGRTGRMGAKGTVVSIVTPGEEKTLLHYSKRLSLEMEKVELYRGQLTDNAPKRTEKRQVTKPTNRPKKKVNDKNRK